MIYFFKDKNKVIKTTQLSISTNIIQYLGSTFQNLSNLRLNLPAMAQLPRPHLKTQVRRAEGQGPAVARDAGEAGAAGPGRQAGLEQWQRGLLGGGFNPRKS